MTLHCFNVTPDDNNNMTSVMPEEESSAVELIRLIIMDFAVPFVCCLGLLGNLLSLVVLATERMHRTLTKMEISAHIGLIALAVSDFLFCLLVLTFTQVTPKHFYEKNDGLIYFHLLANGLITLFIIASTWLIVVMAAERYVAVCHPLRARKLISLRRTRVVTSLVFLLCSVSTVPIFLERTIVERVCSDGRIVYQLQRRSEQSVILRRILWAVFFDFIPCVALIYFNTCLIVQIRKAKRLRDDLTHRHSSSRQPSPSAPILIKYNKRNNKHDNEVSLLGSDTSNKFGSKALLRPENGCVRKHHDKGSYADHNCKTMQTKTNDELPNARSSRPNGHGGEAGRPNNSPRNSWSGGDRGSPPSPRMASRSSDAQYEVSKLNGGGGDYVRRAVKISTVKKRPSDGALNSVTATLVAVVILFLILVSPCEILKFSLSYTLTGEHKMVTCITNFMQVLNFSLNFVLYCAVNKSFRYTLRRLAFSCLYSIRGRC